MANKNMKRCSTARAAWQSYSAQVGCVDDKNMESAFLAGIAWTMARMHIVVDQNFYYVEQRLSSIVASQAAAGEIDL